MHLKATIRAKGWMANVWLLLAASYAWLGFAAIINVFNIRYYPFILEFKEQAIYLVFLSSSIDKIALYTLSILMLVSPLTTRRHRYGWKWMLWGYSLLIPALLMYSLGVRDLGEAFLVMAGFLSLATSLLSMQILSVEKALTRFAIYVCGILFVVESLSLSSWVFHLFRPFTPYQDLSWHAVHLETQLFYIPANLCSIILTITLFSWVVIPVIMLVMRHYGLAEGFRVKIGRKVVEVSSRLGSGFEHEDGQEGMAPRLVSALALVCSMGLSLLYVLYPFFLSANLKESVMRAYVPSYVEWLNEVGERGILDALSYAFSGLRGRPLSLLLIFGVWKVTGFSTQTSVEFTLLLLGPLLILAVYYFMREFLSSSSSSSPIAVLFTSFSYPITVGMYATLISNWVGLIEMYVFSGLLLRSLRKRSWRWGFCSALTAVSLLFTHAWTWGMLMGVLGVYAILLLAQGLRRGSSLRGFKMVVVVMAVNILVDMARDRALGSVVPVVAREATHEAQLGLALKSLEGFWLTLTYTFLHSMAGFYINPPMLSFALLGAFVILLEDDPSRHYLPSWLVASSVPFLLGSRVIQERILYNLPVHVFAALGLDYVSKLIHRWLKLPEAQILKSLFILLVVLVNANYGFRCSVSLTSGAALS